MKTIYTVLPIYDSVLKQDYNRTGAIVPIYTPRHRLPSWQYNVEATAVGAVSRIDLVNVTTGALTNITTYFPTLSDDYALTTDTYYKYDGDTLNYLLPYGVFYLKITHDPGYIYYSEIFTVTDIYPKLFTSFTNDSYETWVSSGTVITSAIETGVSGWARSTTTFSVVQGENIRVIFYASLNSGVLPKAFLYIVGVGSACVAEIQVVAGLNDITLVANGSYNNCSLLLWNDTAAGNWYATEVYTIRAYSADYIKIDFHDTHDLGDIVYQDGFTQTLFLSTYLNTPQHEPVMIGDEKDGIFITEKIVTKWKYRIVTYVGPVFYHALIRLPQHDTITITDEVGFTYSPKVGNVMVSPINWNWFDTGTLEIIFNDNSEFIWTSEANNLT